MTEVISKENADKLPKGGVTDKAGKADNALTPKDGVTENGTVPVSRAEHQKVLDLLAKERRDKDTLAKSVQKKDLDANEKEATMADLLKRQKALEDKVTVATTLSKSTLPETIKSILANDLDEGKLTSESFESTSKRYLDIFEQGRQAKLNSQAKSINNDFNKNIEKNTYAEEYRKAIGDIDKLEELSKRRQAGEFN